MLSFCLFFLYGFFFSVPHFLSPLLSPFVFSWYFVLKSLYSFLIFWGYILWRIPWIEGPDGLQSMRLQGVGHAWSDLIGTYTFRSTAPLWSSKWCLWSCCPRSVSTVSIHSPPDAPSPLPVGLSPPLRTTTALKPGYLTRTLIPSWWFFVCSFQFHFLHLQYYSLTESCSNLDNPRRIRSDPCPGTRPSPAHELLPSTPHPLEI